MGGKLVTKEEFYFLKSLTNKRISYKVIHNNYKRSIETIKKIANCRSFYEFAKNRKRCGVIIKIKEIKIKKPKGDPTFLLITLQIILIIICLSK